MRLIDIDFLPDMEDITACAELYLQLSDLRSWSVKASKMLTAETKARGEIESMAGVLTQVYDSYEYPATIADALPQLGRNVYSFSLPMEVNHSRVLEVLLESLPELATELRYEWSVTTKVDTHKAAELAKDVTSLVGDKVRQLRTKRTHLGMKP